MSDIRNKTVRAAGWVMGSRIIYQIISFGIGIALARLLIPDDFGLLAMSLVFIGIAGLLSDVGFGAALIHRKNASDEHFSSVFWLNLIVGIILAIIVYTLSPLISRFYGRTEIEQICKILALIYPISALGMVPRTRLIKDLSFKYVSISDLAAMMISGPIAIAFAISGFGYWSLVINNLLQQIIKTTIIWNVVKWKPNKKISKHALSELFGFSSSVFATQSLQYITRNIDKMLLGKYLGGVSLGLYDKAQSMMLFPLQNISRVIGSVMFPSLSMIQSEKERVKAIYLRSTRAIALFTFPMMAGLFVVADPFVIGVLGHQWENIIPVLRVFCIAGMVRSIVTVTGSLYQSQGAAALQLRVNLITQPMRIIGIVVGLPFGVIGVATGYTVALIINSLITLVIAGRLVELSIFTLMQKLAPILLSTILMSFFVFLSGSILTMKNELIILLLQTILGILIYWVCVVLMKLEAYTDVKGIFVEQLLSRRRRNRAIDENN